MSLWRVFWGLLLIVVGSLFATDQMGLFALNYRLIFPVFLILLGLVVIVFPRMVSVQTAERQVSEPLEGAKEAHIAIEHGGGDLRISGAAARDELLSGRFAYMKMRKELAGKHASVKLKSALAESMQWIFPWNWASSGHSWDFSLNPDIPISLKLETGANNTRLDLRELHVTDIKLETGASATTVILPAQAGFTRLEADFGAASLDLTVPEGVAADIRIDSGLASVKVDEQRFPRVGSHYTSPDYASAANKAEIHIDTGVSSVAIR